VVVVGVWVWVCALFLFEWREFSESDRQRKANPSTYTRATEYSPRKDSKSDYSRELVCVFCSFFFFRRARFFLFGFASKLSLLIHKVELIRIAGRRKPMVSLRREQSRVMRSK
jgi:hypothetical protein